MKNRNRILGAVLAALLASCSATNQLTMGALEPAPVHLPKTITKIGILNRSLPSEANRTLDKIDQILSAEGLHLDKNGAAAATKALQHQLERHQSFEAVKLLEEDSDTGVGLGVFPATLPWETVVSLCGEHGVDALFTLAFYDTDTRATYKATTVNLPNPLGVEVPVPGHEIRLQTQIDNGWRIYYPEERQIVDEFHFTEELVSEGRGINPMKALEAVVGRNQAVLERSKHIGGAYALRLIPFKTRISRDYYVRGSDNFVRGKRMAQTGDWDGASKLWERELENPDRKIAGRAHYNMAIINEINGNLPEAMDWASRAYVDYGDKNALRYLDMLKYRFARNEALEQQLSR
ncbi:MAG: DUF6340 family protein [Bacteroidota bacterium]